MAHLDIIIYAVIAIVLLARLWIVFGRRNDGDLQRPNPFTAPPAGLQGEEDRLDAPVKKIAPPPPPTLAPNSLLGALAAVKEFDPSFDERQFLRDARTIFTDTIQAFAAGDLAKVEIILSPSVYQGFQSAIEARKAAGEILNCRLINIRDVETASARVEEPYIYITVRFVSEQENILRDAAGKILSGAENKSEEIIDLWTFSRDPKAENYGWRLAVTKS